MHAGLLWPRRHRHTALHGDLAEPGNDGIPPLDVAPPTCAVSTMV